MGQRTKEIYEFGPFRLDAQERLLRRDGAAVSLTPKAFDLLLVLVERQGRLLGKEELFQAVWPDTIVEESNLSSNVALIRKALGDGTNSERYIETVPKRGYRFVSAVQEVSRGEEKPTSNATLPTHETRVEVAKPRRRFHPLLWVLPVSGLLVVGYFASVRWFASRGSDVVPPTTTAPFTTLPGRESEPTFSPDGNQIAFVWNGERGDNADIYVKQIGNETPVRLTTNPAPDRGPSWSPDGRWIAFTRRRSDEIGLYLLPSLGGAERKIAALPPRLLPEFPVPLSWTPDSQWLAVQDKSSPQEPYGIWLMARETGEKRRLTTPQTKDGDGQPTVSPDGKTVLFTRDHNQDLHDLYLVPITGGEPRQVLFDQETSVSQPIWTRDGGAILFISNREPGRGGPSNLWKVPVTGGTPLKVEVVRENLSNFALSRQGTRLAWAQSTDDTNIWRLELNATGKPKTVPQQLIASTRLDVDGRFSPDGSRIAFASNRSGSWQIWVAESDGQRPVQLTSFNGPLTGSPRWSPDARQIAFDSRAAGNSDIYVISVEGGKPRRLTTEPSNEALPSWSGDSAWIYFCSDCNSGNQQIWKMPAAGGQAVQVTRNGGFDNVESPDGQYLYFTKGYRVPGIWRLPVAGGEETLVLNHHSAGQWRYWAVKEQGIYLATAETPEHPLLEFFSFATNKVTPLATLDKKISYFGFAGLDVSSDGRWLIWQQLDEEGSDIMLMENFRWL
jgi:Tol biopolymer transport system component/DNA-binding winged helix-turn-helix (wHTH) protein